MLPAGWVGQPLGSRMADLILHFAFAGGVGSTVGDMVLGTLLPNKYDAVEYFSGHAAGTNKVAEAQEKDGKRMRLEQRREEDRGMRTPHGWQQLFKKRRLEDEEERAREGHTDQLGVGVMN